MRRILSHREAVRCKAPAEVVASSRGDVEGAKDLLVLNVAPGDWKPLGAEAEFAKFWNMTREQLYRTVTSTGHCNWIQAWKISRDGKVTNGLPPVAAVADVHSDVHAD